MASSAVIASKRKRTLAPHFRAPDGKVAFRAIFDGMVAPLLPAVWRAFDEYVPKRYWASHKRVSEIYNTGFTYLGLNAFMDGSFAEAAPGFVDQSWFDQDNKMSNGLNYHGDNGNALYKFGAILALGNFNGFHQHYPAFNVTMLAPNFALIIGDYTELWHAVGPGSGFRFSVTLFDHEVNVTGVRALDGYRVDWSEVVDQRPEAEQYDPDIWGLVEAAYNRVCSGQAFQ